MKLQDLKADDKNANKHTERGDAMLEQSLRKHGAGRSILIDKDNRIIAGYATVENAGQIGLEEVIVVETTGDKLVAVKRMDLSLDDPKTRELALLDNRVSEVNLNWDSSALAELQAEGVDLSTAFTEAELQVRLAQLDEAAPRDADGSRGLGNPVVSYTIVFDNEEQQARWFEFMRKVKQSFPRDTFAASLDAYITPQAKDDPPEAP